MADIRSLKGQRPITMLKVDSAEEAAAASEAGIDILSIHAENWSPRMREAAGNCFVQVVLLYGIHCTQEDYLRGAHRALLDGSDCVYCCAGLKTIELLAGEAIPVVGHAGLIPAKATWTGLAFVAWGTWWSVSCFLVYGVLYGSCGDSRWHECGHGTAFRTPWMNTVVYHIASFMILRNGTRWRWSHSRHHTDTIVVGRDPEITVERPPNLGGAVIDLLYLRTGFGELCRMVRHIFGWMTPAERDFVPETERWKVFLEARLQFAVLAAVTLWSFAIGSIMPLMFVGLPTFFGAWMDLVLFGYTQHAGLAEDVTDHRLNSRTVYFNPIFRFIYWNMNYHVERHMFPMVPYHALPRLHTVISFDCPPAYPNLLTAWREILPALWQQLKDPSYFVKRPIPPAAPLPRAD